jgi:feruloyl esterase
MKNSTFALFGILAGLVPLSPAARAATCESIASLKLPDATITSARAIAAGKYVLPPQPPREAHMDSQPIADFDYASLPAFCQVMAVIQTSADSRDQIEVWLPIDTWNGKLLVHTFRYFGGLMEPPMLADAVKHGYASVTTDLGSGRNQSAKWMYGHPEYVKDWAYRGWHEATLKAKALMDMYYGRGPRYSYMDSCGGAVRSTLKEIQMFPDDYDAISTSLHTAYASRLGFGETRALLFKGDEAGNLGNKVEFLHRAVMDKCDALDGLKDGTIGNPEGCLKKFDPASLRCQGADGPNCLTAPQVARVRAWYDLVRNPRTNEQLSGRRYPGSELTFNGGLKLSVYSVDFFRYFVFKDLNWDPEKRPVNFDSDVALADASDGVPGNAVDPNIAPFLKRGGKLLLVPGWYDNIYATTLNIDYYNAVREKVGEQARDSVRMFMLPDVSSCPDGRVDFVNAVQPGSKIRTLDTLTTLTAWREKKVTPNTMLLHEVQNSDVRDRLLCPYPQVGFYKGKGNINDPSNFVCKPAE